MSVCAWLPESKISNSCKVVCLKTNNRSLFDIPSRRSRQFVKLLFSNLINGTALNVYKTLARTNKCRLLYYIYVGQQPRLPYGCRSTTVHHHSQFPVLQWRPVASYPLLSYHILSYLILSYPTWAALGHMPIISDGGRHASWKNLQTFRCIHPRRRPSRFHPRRRPSRLESIASA